jgi:hypothetical protein
MREERFQHERPGAHRVLADLVAVELDHLAGQGGRHVRVGHLGQHEAGRRARQLDLEGVAVQRLQPFNRRVVVEGLLLGHQPLAQFRQAQHLGVFQAVEVGAFPLRVVMALQAVDIVFGHQFALLHHAVLALEGRVVGEVDARLELESEGLEVVRHLGHGDQGVRPHARGLGQEFEFHGRVEQARHHGVRVQVADLRRVEGGLGNEEGIAQHLQGLHCRRRGRTLGGDGRSHGRDAACERQACGPGAQGCCGHGGPNGMKAAESRGAAGASAPVIPRIRAGKPPAESPRGDP